MRQPPLSPSIAMSAQKPAVTETRLHGRWLRMARLVWIMLSLFLIGVAIACLPACFAALHQPCTFDVGECNGVGYLTASQIRTLSIFGLSIDAYAWSWIVANGLSALLLFVMGGILFWRRSDDWMVLLVALMFICIGATNVTNVLQFSSSLWGMLENIVLLINSVAILLTLALFPNGRFVPRWAGGIVLLYPAYAVFYLVFLNQLHIPGWLLFNNPVNGVLWFGCWGILTLAQLYRYFRVSTPIEQQQSKWVAFTFFLILILGVVGLATTPTLLSLVHNGYLYLITTNLGPILGLLIPLSFVIAILRYRLWDIDVIIRRTLIYGSLTALLAALYFGLIFALQFLFQGTFHQGNAVAIVISTLVIAAVFQPVRKRIQAFIDRRFYRRKYDAQQTLAAFSATLRQEVDLDTLRDQLIAVVQETMQPEHVSLWLSPPEPTRKHQMPWSSAPLWPEGGEEG
jgi:hypothetical protein